MADPQDTITVHTIERSKESKKNDSAYGVSASAASQKYKYRAKDGILETRKKARRAAVSSDSVILAAHDLMYHQRYNTCNENCRRAYRLNGIPDLRWRRERPAHPPIPYYPGSGLVANRPWNVSTINFSRPPLEMPASPIRRKYLQKSLTSSELIGPKYRRCLPAIPIQKTQKNSLYGSSKSVHAYDCVQPKSETMLTSKSDHEKENQPVSCNSETSVQVPNSSACSSTSDGSVDPKTSSTVSTLPMGSPKHGDSFPGPRFGSQFSLIGNQCCQNCHMMQPVTCQKSLPSRWNSLSTVGEGHYVPVDGSHDGLSWRRLHMSRAKLKATATTSELLSGFAMVAMVELQINDKTSVPEWLFIMFSVTTTVLVAVHIFALMISTYLLPNIDAASKLHSTKLFTESPHERMKGFIELAWAFSTVLGLFLFLVEVAILCWVKFWDFSLRAAMAATIIVIPVLIIFIIFVFHFWRVLVVHKCKSTLKSIDELETIRKKLDSVSPV